VISLQQYLLEETGGRMPIHVVDMQGPADVCGKMWGYDNLFLCAQDHPEAYDRLMTKVADGFIFFWNRQKEILGDCFVPTHLMNWMPDSAGATASFDSMVMLSPLFYERFYKPYVSKLGEAFGGITIHACGRFPGIVKNLCETPFLRGFDTSEMPLDIVVKAGIDSKTLVSTWFLLDDVEKWYDVIRQTSIRCDSSIYGLWPSQEPTAWTDEEWRTIQTGVERAENAAHI
jgi:uroporphyrinogen-III decarboxylase